MLKGCNGNSIAASADGGSSDAFGNHTKNRADWESRLTYNLPAVGAGDKPAIVPQGAEYLIMTRFPYLSANQLREVLRMTELPSGIVLDNGEGWARLDLFRAADGYGAIEADTTVPLDAARAADDTQPGAGYNASDVWRNDISGNGVLTKAGSGELTLTGHNTFGGLSVSGGTLRLTGINSTAGLRTSWSLAAGRLRVRPYADVAWRHVLRGETPAREMMFAYTGAGFRVRGAPLSADAAVAGAGAGIELADAGKETRLTLGWNGIYGENGRQENAGNLRLNVAF